ARNHRRAQGSLRSIVGRLDSCWLMEKTRQIAAVVMAPDLVQQPLIDLVFEQAGSQMVSHFLLSRLRGFDDWPLDKAARTSSPLPGFCHSFGFSLAPLKIAFQLH